MTTPTPQPAPALPAPLIDAIRRVIDDCMVAVPSRPLIELSNLIDDPALFETDDPLARELLELADTVATDWAFWPPEEFGSTRATPPDLETLADLRDALDAWEAAA
jgi:hypothetical protein